MERTALIIGASSEGGLGEATARRLSRDGLRLVLAGRNTGRLKLLGDQIGAVGVHRCDITDEAQVRALAATCDRIDVLVNAAGTTMGRSILKLGAEELQAQMTIHVAANMWLMKHFVPVMARPGNIVLFSSIVARRAGYGLAAYGAAKAALEQLVRVAALEFGELGIRVNAVAPGYSCTPMTEVFLTDADIAAAYARETALGKLTAPEDVAAAVSYLAAADCNATGESIQASGGAQLCRVPRKDEFRA